jgi:hypothetical protein
VRTTNHFFDAGGSWSAFQTRKDDDAAAQYKKCERHCLWAIEHSSSDTKAEVQQQLSLCKLNRSLCLYKTKLYKETHKLCVQVLDDHVSLEYTRCKAGIRAGQCLINMYIASCQEERSPALLAQALKCADSAELLCNGDADFVAAIARVRYEAREKLLEAGFSAVVPPATCSSSSSSSIGIACSCVHNLNRSSDGLSGIARCHCNCNCNCTGTALVRFRHWHRRIGFDRSIIIVIVNVSSLGQCRGKLCARCCGGGRLLLLLPEEALAGCETAPVSRVLPAAGGAKRSPVHVAAAAAREVGHGLTPNLRAATP